MTDLFARFKRYVIFLKTEVNILYIVSKDKRTPWLAKLIAIIVVAYLFSPIDLIPDFIPVLGYLDDLILVPAGIVLALKIIPDAVLLDARAKAALQLQKRKPVNYFAATLIVLAWLGLAAWGVHYIMA